MSDQNQGAQFSQSRPLPPTPPDWQPQPPPRRKRGYGKLIAAIVVLLLLFVILFYTPIGNMLFSELSGRSYARNSSFTLERVITIETTREISYLCDIPISLGVTFSGEYVQKVTGMTFSPEGTHIDKYGESWYQWSGTENGHAELHVTSHATVNTMVWNIDGKTSGLSSDIPAGYLSVQSDDEWEVLSGEGAPTGEYRIWPSHTTISHLADSLTSDELTVYENVKRIYDYVRDNIDYQTFSGSEPKTCLQTLQDGNGDCDDQSILMISMLRSIGIPSWLAFGSLYDGARGLWGPHAWAEIYIPLNDGGGEEVVIDVVNAEFLLRNCNRLEEWKSDGNGEHLQDYYSILSYNYTVMPGQPAPIVTISDECSGEYEASKERVYAFMLDIGDIQNCEAIVAPSQSSLRKVF